jgi:hypothetical protein
VLDLKPYSPVYPLICLNLLIPAYAIYVKFLIIFFPLYPQENYGTCVLIGLYQLSAKNDPDLSPYASLYKAINLHKFAYSGISD